MQSESLNCSIYLQTRDSIHNDDKVSSDTFFVSFFRNKRQLKSTPSLLPAKNLFHCCVVYCHHATFSSLYPKRYLHKPHREKTNCLCNTHKIVLVFHLYFPLLIAGIELPPQFHRFVNVCTHLIHRNQSGILW